MASEMVLIDVADSLDRNERPKRRKKKKKRAITEKDCKTNDEQAVKEKELEHAYMEQDKDEVMLIPNGNYTYKRDQELHASPKELFVSQLSSTTVNIAPVRIFPDNPMNAVVKADHQAASKASPDSPRCKLCPGLSNENKIRIGALFSILLGSWDRMSNIVVMLMWLDSGDNWWASGILVSCIVLSGVLPALINLNYGRNCFKYLLAFLYTCGVGALYDAVVLIYNPTGGVPHLLDCSETTQLEMFYIIRICQTLIESFPAGAIQLMILVHDIEDGKSLGDSSIYLISILASVLSIGYGLVTFTNKIAFKDPGYKMRNLARYSRSFSTLLSIFVTSDLVFRCLTISLFITVFPEHKSLLVGSIFGAEFLVRALLHLAHEGCCLGFEDICILATFGTLAASCVAALSIVSGLGAILISKIGFTSRNFSKPTGLWWAQFIFEFLSRLALGAITTYYSLQKSIESKLWFYAILTSGILSFLAVIGAMLFSNLTNRRTTSKPWQRKFPQTDVIHITNISEEDDDCSLSDFDILDLIYSPTIDSATTISLEPRLSAIISERDLPSNYGWDLPSNYGSSADLDITSSTRLEKSISSCTTESVSVEPKDGDYFSAISDFVSSAHSRVSPWFANTISIPLFRNMKITNLLEPKKEPLCIGPGTLVESSSRTSLKSSPGSSLETSSERLTLESSESSQEFPAVLSPNPDASGVAGKIIEVQKMGIKLFKNMKITNLLERNREPMESPSESLTLETSDPPLKFPAFLLRSPDANRSDASLDGWSPEAPYVAAKIVTFDDNVKTFSK